MESIIEFWYTLHTVGNTYRTCFCTCSQIWTSLTWLSYSAVKGCLNWDHWLRRRISANISALKTMAVTEMLTTPQAHNHGHSPNGVEIGDVVATEVTFGSQPACASLTHVWSSWFQKRSPHVMCCLRYVRSPSGSHRKNLWQSLTSGSHSWPIV